MDAKKVERLLQLSRQKRREDHMHRAIIVARSASEILRSLEWVALLIE